MDEWLSIEHVPRDPVSTRHTEFVERKGVGHPDSLCDGIAEEAGAEFAGVQMLSRIGSLVSEPWAVDVTTTASDDAAIEAITCEKLDSLDALTEGLVAGRVETF